MRSFLFLVLLSASALAQPVMFRGNAAHSGFYQDGHGRNLAGLQWRFATSGEVNGTPVVAERTVYAGSGDGRLYAIDLERGIERWSFDAGSPISSSPAVADGVVFFATRNGTVIAVAQGQPKWRVNTGADIPFPWGHESGDYYVSSPVVAGDRVLFGAGDGNLYAVDRATGRVRWKAATGERIRGTPAVAGGGVFIGTAGGKLYRFDLGTGKQSWAFATAGAALASGDFGYDRRTLQSSPAVSNGIVYVGARDGQFYAVDAATGSLRWKSDYGLPWVIASPAIDAGRVYLDSSDGHFVQCLDAATGKGDLEDRLRHAALVLAGSHRRRGLRRRFRRPPPGARPRHRNEALVVSYEIDGAVLTGGGRRPRRHRLVGRRCLRAPDERRAAPAHRLRSGCAG